MTDSRIVSLSCFKMKIWLTTEDRRISFINAGWRFNEIFKHIDNVVSGTNKPVEINIPFVKSHKNSINITEFVCQKYHNKDITFNYESINSKLEFCEDLFMFFCYGKLDENFYNIFYYYTNIFVRRISILSLQIYNELPWFHFMNKLTESFVDIKNYEERCLECKRGWQISCSGQAGLYYSGHGEIIDYIIENIKMHMAKYPRGQKFKYNLNMTEYILRCGSPTLEQFSDEFLNDFSFDYFKQIESEFPKYYISFSHPVLYIEPRYLVIPNIKSEYHKKYYQKVIPFFYCTGSDVTHGDNDIINSG